MRLLARGEDGVGGEQQDQHDAVDRSDRAAQRQAERVDRGRAQEGQRQRAGAVQAKDAAAADEPGQDGDGRPAEAQQESVGAGHVRDRVRGERRIGAGLVGEDDVDGVLGQDGQQGDHGQGEGARDVVFGGFGGPRNGEGSADDGDAEQQRCHLDRRVQAGKAEQVGGYGHQDGQGDCEDGGAIHPEGSCSVLSSSATPTQTLRRAYKYAVG